MNYAEVTRYLISLGNEIRAAGAQGVQAAKMGLANIRILLEDLGGPQNACPSVLIAGTNGKGSAAAMLASVLQSAGMKTGLYTSPHLVEISERIQVNGRPIPADDFAALFNMLRERIETLLAQDKLQFHPTYFECLTAMGMEYFRRQQCEMVVLEVGMGGRLDATNTVTPHVAIITQIDFDHERYLGTTIEAIAAEKAGIIKPGGVAVSMASQPAAAAVVRETAAGQGARLVEAWKQYSVSQVESRLDSIAFQVRSDHGFQLPVRVGLAGRHQIENVMAVIAARNELEKMGFPISQDSLQKGLSKVRWPGRLELIHKKPLVFLDGTHNPAGARALVRFWEETLRSRRVLLIFGAMRDKAVEEVMELLLPRADLVILTRPDQERAASVDAIREISQDFNPNIIVESAPSRAVDLAMEMAKDDDVILITGSLFLAGELRKYWTGRTAMLSGESATAAAAGL